MDTRLDKVRRLLDLADVAIVAGYRDEAVGMYIQAHMIAGTVRDDADTLAAICDMRQNQIYAGKADVPARERVQAKEASHEG